MNYVVVGKISEINKQNTTSKNKFYLLNNFGEILIFIVCFSIFDDFIIDYLEKLS
jgi:hypothetical protein